jgi:hypothetical protein
MNKELFTAHVENYGIKIRSKNDLTLNPFTVSDFRNLKNFIRHVDFNCQINSKGGCRYTPKSLRCCCNNCYEYAGFFRVMIDTDIPKYSRQFSIRTGFWRKDRGCILSHKMRSVTCLTHHCNYDETGSFTYGMNVIKEKLDKLQHRILAPK